MKNKMTSFSLLLLTSSLSVMGSGLLDKQLLPVEKEIVLDHALYLKTSDEVHAPALAGVESETLENADKLWFESLPKTRKILDEKITNQWFPGFRVLEFDPGNIRGPSKCHSDMREIYRLARKYSRRSLNLSDKADQNASPLDANQLLTQIHEKLFGQIYLKQPECFEPAAFTYALASLGEDFPLELAGGAMMTDDVIEGYRALAVLLYNWGFLQIVTPELRCQLGGVWNELAVEPATKYKTPFEILGGYSCFDSTIGLDPQLPPYDLGASLVHEMDHLMRDKLVDPKLLSLDPVSNIILDEGLSSIHASLGQIRTLWKAKTLSNVTPPPYDLSFFDPNPENGGLLSAWLQWMPDKIRMTIGDTGEVNHDFDDMLKKDFLGFPLSWHFSLTFLNQNNITDKTLTSIYRDGKDSLEYKLRQSKSRRFQRQSYQRVARYYNLKTSEGFYSSVEKTVNQLGIQLSPLSEWTRLAVPSSSVYATQHRAWVQYIYYNLHQRLLAPSMFCKALDTPEAKKSLKDYIGFSQPPASRLASCSQRKVRKRVMILHRGTRWGADGVRPGADGVRPAVRPCVRMAL